MSQFSIGGDNHNYGQQGNRNRQTFQVNRSAGTEAFVDTHMSPADPTPLLNGKIMTMFAIIDHITTLNTQTTNGFLHTLQYTSSSNAKIAAIKRLLNQSISGGNYNNINWRTFKDIKKQYMHNKTTIPPIIDLSNHIQRNTRRNKPKRSKPKPEADYIALSKTYSKEKEIAKKQKEKESEYFLDKHGNDSTRFYDEDRNAEIAMGPYTTKELKKENIKYGFHYAGCNGYECYVYDCDNIDYNDYVNGYINMYDK